VCLLLYGDKLSAIARKRLHMMKQTDDGFELAEADLRLRGGGDTLGLRQSGLPQFRFAVFDSEDPDMNDFFAKLYEDADGDAKRLLEQDPQLISDRGAAARVLMTYAQLTEVALLKKAG
jgi:ATP-dependent DNA helicase RecG